MLKLELNRNNEPILTYEIVVDLGDNRTKTVYTASTLTGAYRLITFIQAGDLDIPNLDLNKDELELIKTIGINVVLTSKNLTFTCYESKQSAMALVKSFRVI